MNFEFLKSDKKTFKYLAIVCAIILSFVAIFLVVYSDTYHTCSSDDILQYFKMSEDFIIKLKTGNLSYYYYNSYLGASIFADTYYVPIDIFTFITTIISFVTKFEVAFGLTELIKLFLGTMMFAYFLKLRKFSNKAIFITSILYMVCGYNTTMMVFPAFFSLVFYFPFSAVCLEQYKRGKKFLLPLCAAMLLFYNFYLGACTMIFMAVWFVFSYLLDNKLIVVKEELLAKDPNTKRLTLRALFIYIGRAIKEGFRCALFMLIGIAIACIILLPSITYFLNDSLPRADTAYYIWSFDAKSPFTEISSKAQYARILAELFTPSYPCGFYAFNNSYITDHISLYITVTGLIMVLYVFQLKDRESWFYKLLLVGEVILLAFPIFYMLFSLNSAPYTRWIGMLNLFNLVIMAHVITKTDFKLKLTCLWSLIRSALLIVCILVVINYFTNRLYGVNLIVYFAKYIAGGELNQVWTLDSFNNMVEDVWYMVAAIVIIIILTIGSLSKVIKKVDIMPYVLGAEIILAAAWMFVGRFDNYNLITLSANKEHLNRYLEQNLEIPYDGQFARTSLDTDASNEWVYSRSFTRTNLLLSDLRIFHSFYDDGANDFVTLVYESKSASNETRNSKEVIDQYSIFVHQLLGTRYVVIDDDENKNYLPEDYYRVVEGSDNSGYIAYENINYHPFMVYDEKCRISSTGDYSSTYFGLAKTQLSRQQFLLNGLCYKGETKLNLAEHSPSINTYKKNYTQSGNSQKYDFYEEETNMIGYYISNQDYSNTYGLPEKGIMHFYYDVPGSGVRGVEFGKVVLEFKDGHREDCFSGYAFYDEIPTAILIENNGDVVGLGDGTRHTLYIEYTDYAEYDNYIERMKEYEDLSLKMDGSKLHLSYKRNDASKENVVVVPITYNDDWKISKDYKIISANEGFLGIVIPAGEEEISFTLEFVPGRLKTSALVSICGALVFGLYIVLMERAVTKREEDIDYSALL